MGQVAQILLDDWEAQQQADHLQSRRITAVKLPCCGSMVEVTADKMGEDQYITCPEKLCGKHHLLTWGMNPTLRSESVLDVL